MKSTHPQTTVLFAPFESSHVDGAFAFARGTALHEAHLRDPERRGQPLLVSIPGMADGGTYFKQAGRALKALRPNRAFEESLAYAIKSKIQTLPDAGLLAALPPNAAIEVIGPGLVVEEVVGKLLSVGFLREKVAHDSSSSSSPASSSVSATSPASVSSAFRLRHLALDRPDGAMSGPLRHSSAVKVTRAALKRAKRGEGAMPAVWSMGSQGEDLATYLGLGRYGSGGGTDDTFTKMGYDVRAYDSSSLWLLHDPGEFKLLMEKALAPLREGKHTGIILCLPGATEPMLQEAARFDEAFHKRANEVVAELEASGRIDPAKPLNLSLHLVIEALSFEFFLKVLGHPSFETYGMELEGNGAGDEEGGDDGKES